MFTVIVTVVVNITISSQLQMSSTHGHRVVCNTYISISCSVDIAVVVKQLEQNQKTRRRIFMDIHTYPGSRDSVVGIATGYGLDDRGVGVQVPVVSKIFSSPRRPDMLWDPPNLPSNGYRGLFPGG
jgi:hypothetical protein